MKYIISFLVWMCLYIQLSAKTDTLYYRWGKPTTPSDSFSQYYLVSEKNSEGRYLVKKYDLDWSLSAEEYYKNIGTYFDTLDGWSIIYDSTGSPIEKGIYKNNHRDGKWVEFYSGTNNVRYEALWDEGDRKGLSKNYFLSGKLKRIEEYEDGHFKQGQQFDEEGEEVEFSMFWRMPEPHYQLLTYLSENLRYPKSMKRKGVEGRVFVKFVIRKDGTIADVKAIKSPHPILSEEAERVIRIMPKWEPGRKDNILVDVYYTQPINFKLQ